MWGLESRVQGSGLRMYGVKGVWDLPYYISCISNNKNERLLGLRQGLRLSILDRFFLGVSLGYRYCDVSVWTGHSNLSQVITELERCDKARWLKGSFL